MFTKQLLNAMRNPVPFDNLNGIEYVRPNICGRTFVIYVNDIKPCLDYLGNRCYRKFFGGQMEHVLHDYVAISFIKTPLELKRVVRELRNIGVRSTLEICVEYVEGCIIPFTKIQGGVPCISSKSLPIPTTL